MTKTVSNRSKLGFFGGSFDPVHEGHVEVAKAALAKGLDHVFWIPAYHSPLKNEGPQASNLDRICMLKLAMAPQAHMSLLYWELFSPGKSYTIDTMKRAKSIYPDKDLVWILGNDQFQNLPQWNDIEELCALVEFWVYPRRECNAVTNQEPLHLKNLKFQYLEGEFWDTSSSNIRKNLKKQIDEGKGLPELVFQYIQYSNCFSNPLS